MKYLISLITIAFVFSCKSEKKETEEVILWTAYNDSAEVAANQDHEVGRMQYKLIQSKVLDKNDVFLPLYQEVSKMSEEEYEAIRPLVLEQDIPTIQRTISSGKLTYEKLVLFYLYRIYKYELDNTTTLNTIIALNKSVVEEARKLDALEIRTTEKRHPIFGMPILLKDNINTIGMNTTAGSIALLENEVDDAFIVERLKQHGALILGKANLSEWGLFSM